MLSVFHAFICLSSSEQCLFIWAAHFLTESFIFPRLIMFWVIYLVLCLRHYWGQLSHLAGSLFTLLFVFLAEQKPFNLLRPHLLSPCNISCATGFQRSLNGGRLRSGFPERNLMICGRVDIHTLGTLKALNQFNRKQVIWFLKTFRIQKWRVTRLGRWGERWATWEPRENAGMGSAHAAWAAFMVHVQLVLG